MDLIELKNCIVTLAKAEGFDDCAIVDICTSEEDKHRLFAWLAEQRYGEMTYLARHAAIRTEPTQLLDRAIRVICVRMTYLSQPFRQAADARQYADQAYIAQYALGRDYHKVIKQRLNRLVSAIQSYVPDAAFRICCDSAPLMEVAYASRSQLGWRGKNGLLIHPKSGSFFVLGEILTDLALPIDMPIQNRCGQCRRCLDHCPTKALRPTLPLQADQCISYLTIEHRGTIPEALRPLIGNRIFGCDECQFNCPWNRFSKPTRESDFQARPMFLNMPLTALFRWTPEEFDRYTAGSPIRRLKYPQWIRNIAIALGNAPASADIINALKTRVNDPDPLIAEHVQWALAQHMKKI